MYNTKASLRQIWEADGAGRIPQVGKRLPSGGLVPDVASALACFQGKGKRTKAIPVKQRRFESAERSPAADGCAPGDSEAHPHLTSVNRESLGASIIQDVSWDRN